MDNNGPSALKALFSLLPSSSSIIGPPLGGDRDLKDRRGGSLDFLYENGKPRLHAARSWFLDLQDLDLQGLTDYYRSWRELPEFLVLQKQTWMGDHTETKTIAVKCAKRGNDVYRRRVRRRLSWFYGTDLEFFRKKDKVPKTKVLFFTLTYDPGRSSIHEAWEGVGSEFNRWITGLRKAYGRILCLRTWEGMESGYPHVHGILIFDREFEVFPQRRKEDGELVWRISEKPSFELWPGFVDLRAVRTLVSVIRYVEKRILYGQDRDLEDRDPGDLTLALCWVYRKRSFSVSKDLQASIKNDLMVSLHNSNQGVQTTIEGVAHKVVWVLIVKVRPDERTFTMEELKLKGKDPPWTIEIDPKILPSNARIWGEETKP